MLKLQKLRDISKFPILQRAFSNDDPVYGGARKNPVCRFLTLYKKTLFLHGVFVTQGIKNREKKIVTAT